MKFKCPVCATILVFDGEQQRIRCPDCATAFDQMKIRELFARQKLQRSRLAEIVPPTPAKPTAADAAVADPPNIHPEVASPIRRSDELQIRPAAESSNIGVESGFINSNSPKLIQIRHRRADRRLIAMAVLVLLAAGLSGGLLFVLRPPRSLPAGSSASVPVDEPDVADDRFKPGTEITDSDAVDFVEENVMPREPFEELDSPDLVAPKPANTYKTAKILRDCWFKAQPYLVEVRAETPTGTRYATGTIIDTRGWLLTSYRAVAGADRIDIRPSRKSGSESLLEPSIVDQVRGVVAADPSRDLIVLAVNPRFVVAFADLSIATDERIVGSQYLIQCQPPTAAYPYSTVETRVERTASLKEMSPEAAERMTRNGLADENVRWIVHQQESPLNHGAPLFNDSGQLVAINSAAEKGADVFSVPAEYIAAIKNSGGGAIKPLPIPGVSGAAMATGGDEGSTAASETEMKVVESQSQSRELSESLNRSATECELFSWRPSSMEEALQLRQFAQYMFLAREQSESSDATVDTETLATQVAQWSAAVGRSLGIESASKRETQIAFNRLVNVASGPGDELFFGFALVEYSAMESPKVAIGDSAGGDTVVFQFVGGGGHIIANLSTDWPPLPPDSPWLVIGRRIAGEVRLKNRSNQNQTLQPAVVYFVFQADTP